MARRFLGGIVFLLALASPAWALAPTAAVIAIPAQPGWKDLGAEYQKILAPLARDWDQMENFRRKKWLGIADRYPKMTKDAQRRVDERMRQWAGMTPEQRAKVRNDYKAFSQLPPEKKAAIQKKWQDYSSLSEEEKGRLKRGEKPVAVSPQGRMDVIPEAANAEVAGSSEKPANGSETRPER